MDPKTTKANSSDPIKRNITAQEHMTGLWANFQAWFAKLIDLEAGSDRDGAVRAIKEGKRMQGSNAWMLICSIVIASLGLDLNSGAVIIGAMLISPLMSPILGIGLAVATNDRDALRIAAQHFGIAIVLALITSTFYFLITPLGQVTDEIRGRTEPTFLDGLIAIFGGLAGIISITRADRGNAIPGVAIATALMPPLCVTGYGLASANWQIALNSFYLFFLNSFFIALTSYLIIRLLRFPRVSWVNARESRRARLYIGLFSIVIIIPSAIILENVYQDLRYQRNVNTFVKEQFPKTCVDHKIFYINDQKDTALLVTQLVGQALPDSTALVYYDSLLAYQYNLPTTFFRPISDNSLQLQQLDRLQYEVSNLGGAMKEQVEALRGESLTQQAANEALEQELAIYHPDTSDFRRLGIRLHAAFPDIDRFSIGRMQSTNFDTLRDSVPTVLVDWRRGLPSTKRREEEQRLQDFLKADLELDTLEIIRW